MSATALDLLLIASLARDLVEFDLPNQLFSPAALVFPFFLGMAAANRGSRGRIWVGGDPGLVRSLIASGLTLVSIALFASHLAAQGLSALFPIFLAALVVVYLVGRLIGMTLWALLLLGALLIAARWLVG